MLGIIFQVYLDKTQMLAYLSLGIRNVTFLISAHLRYLRINAFLLNNYETISKFAVAVSLVLSTTYLLFEHKVELNQINQTNAISPGIILSKYISKLRQTGPLFGIHLDILCSFFGILFRQMRRCVDYMVCFLQQITCLCIAGDVH